MFLSASKKMFNAGGPPVAFDSVGAQGIAPFGGTNNVTESHTIGATANAVLLGVTVLTTGSGTATATAKVGSTSMTQLTSFNYASPVTGNTGTNAYIFIFGLLNPPTGTQTMACTTTGSTYVGMSSVSYKNVGSFGTSVTASGTGTALSQTVTSSGAGQMVFQMFTQASYSSGTFTGSTYTAGNNTTLRSYKAWTNAQTPAFMLGDEPGSGSNVFAATQNASQQWGSAAIPLHTF